MNDPSDARIDAIAEAIESYLAAHPYARDTVHGVRDWWLPADLRLCPIGEVEQALWRLVGTGRAVAVQAGTGETLFARPLGTN